MKGRKEDVELDGAVWFQKSQHRFLGGESILLLDKIHELGSINSAAKAVGISYKTAWHQVDMMNNLADKPLVERVAGGKGGGGTLLTREGKQVIEQFRVVQDEHRKFLHNLETRLGDSNLYQFLQRISMKVSARNVFSGTIQNVTKGAVNAEVTLALNGGALITAIITNGAVDNLDLKEGMNAFAIIKSSSIIIGQELHDAKLSARNILPGKITRIIEGPVSTEVNLEIDGGNVISAIITHGSSEKLSLKVGDTACSLFKASSVILGVS